MDDKELLKECKKKALSILEKRGISDRIYCYLGKTNDKCVGLYKAKSQFRSSPRVVVYLSEIQNHFLENEQALYKQAVTDTILHEYGHIIYEWAKYRNKELFERINELFETEEDFAEAMITDSDYLPDIKTLCKWYNDSINESTLTNFN